jgi:hypothetical protein
MLVGAVPNWDTKGTPGLRIGMEVAQGCRVGGIARLTAMRDSFWAAEQAMLQFSSV